MSGLLLCISGRIGSGKSTLSHAVAQKLGWSLGSFGDYVRSVARLRGLPLDRGTLQVLGADLLSEDPERFCRSVLNDAGWDGHHSVVLDGVRHVEVLDTLRNLVMPARVALIFLDVGDQERRKRLSERSGDLNLEIADTHSTEAQAGLLRERADLLLTDSGDSEFNQTQVLRFVNESTQ